MTIVSIEGWCNKNVDSKHPTGLIQGVLRLEI